MQQSNTLPVEMRIACCNVCLLAEHMKDCKTCAFQIGLLHKAFAQVKQIEVLPMPGTLRAEFIDSVSILKG